MGVRGLASSSMPICLFSMPLPTSAVDVSALL